MEHVLYVSELCALILQCKYILYQYPNYSVEFVKRQTNVIVHSLARVTTNYARLNRYQLVSVLENRVFMSVM